ncbi:MAG: MT-A70 family methyltransferase [Rectinema sp.]
MGAAEDFSRFIAGRRFSTILADPPWRFLNRTGKVAPEHKRLNRYSTLGTKEICSIPVSEAADIPSHLYLWVPNALLPDGLDVMKAWGFTYKGNIVWHKIRKDGGPDGRGVGFYFRNTTELLLFGIRGTMRTLPPGRSQVNIIKSMKQEHSRKPDAQYDIIQACSPGPYLEMFARGKREGWTLWGDQADEYEISWDTYKNNSESVKKQKSGNKRGIQPLLEVGERPKR